MLTSQRKAHLLELLAREGRIVAREAAARLSLSEDTIRRDLRELAAEGRLQRVHGGALPASPALGTFGQREKIGDAGKAAIAKAAVAMIGPGDVVAIDGGTTAVQLARHLPHDLAATVITHSPPVAVALANHATLEIILIGGRLYKHSIVSTGSAALEAISRIKADMYFMGATGIHADAGLTTATSRRRR